MSRRTISTTVRTVGIAAWGVAAASLMVIGLSTTASAHTAPISASCEAGLAVSLTDYSADGVNTVRVWIDGAERANTAFGASTSASFSFGDPNVTHTWRVSVSAFDDPTGANGWSFDTGTNSIPVCASAATSAPAPASTAPASTEPATTAPATTAPASTEPATTSPAAAATTVVAAAVPVTTYPTAATPPSKEPTVSPVVSAKVAQEPPVPRASAGSGTLPVTGQSNMGAVGVSLLLFGFGILLIVATRRPDTA